MAEFDWNKAAEPEDEPEAFDWNTAAEPDAAPATPSEPPGILDTITRQVAQGATGYWSDELRGKVAKSMAGDALEGVPEAIEQQYLTEERSKLKKMNEERPYLSFVANLAGDLGRDFLLSKAGVPVSNQMYQAAVGAISGAGAADADTGRLVKHFVPSTGAIEDDETRGKLAGAGVGATASYAGHLVGSKLVGPALTKGGALLKALPESLRHMAERRAFKAAGPMLKDFRKVGGVDGAQEVGRDLLDQGVVTFGRNAEEIAEAAAPKTKEIGARIGAVRQKLDASLPADVLPTGSALSSRIEQEVLAPLMASPANRRFAPAIKALAQEFADEGDAPVNMSKLTGWKKDLADQINYGATDPSLPVELKKKVARILQDEEDKLARIGLDEDPTRRQLQRFADDMDGIAQASGDEGSAAIAERMRKLASEVGEDTAEYRELKRLYGNLAEASKYSNDQALRQQANRILSHSDQGLGAAMAAGRLGQGGAPAESTLTGMAVALGNKLFRERGNSAAAVGLDQLSRLPGLGWVSNLSGAGAQKLGKYTPQLLRAAARGPHALAMAVYFLGEMDPEFKAMKQDADQP